MKKHKMGLLGISLLCFLVALFGTFLLLYFYPIFYVEMNVLLGLMLVPALSFGVSLLFLLLIRRIKRERIPIVPSLLITPLLVTLIFIYGLKDDSIQSYFVQLYYSRMAYERAGSETKIEHLATSQMAEDIKRFIPPEYRLKKVTSNEEQPQLYWFMALEPSTLVGSREYIGFYDQSNGHVSQLMTPDELWKLLLEEQNLDSRSSYTDFNEFLYRSSVQFSVNRGIFHVQITKDADRIKIRNVSFVENTYVDPKS